MMRSSPCSSVQRPASPQNSTGKERDAETGLDYFRARYYSGAQGRFISADPLMASAKAINPQTWNRYSYILNNPLRFVDPDGLEIPDECGKNENCKIKVKVNVIYDKNAYKGKGVTEEQKRDIKKNQIGKATEDFKESNIVLDVKTTEGAMDRPPNQVTGLDADALNVVVSSMTPCGYSGCVTIDKAGNAIIFVDADNNWTFNTVLGANTTEHEMAHQFLGDVYKTASYRKNNRG